MVNHISREAKKVSWLKAYRIEFKFILTVSG